MKRYLVFVYSAYYPEGGMRDFKKDYNFAGQWKSDRDTFAKDIDDAYFQVYDTLRNEIVQFERKLSDGQWLDCLKGLKDGTE